MQLQRDQLLQEDRLRRNTASPFSNNGSSKNNSSAINFPSTTPSSFNNAATELPAKVLKVETRLQNPTNYHVQETQKAQVREFMSQSHSNDGSKYLNKSSFLHPTRSSAPTGGIAQELQQQVGSTPASPMAQLTLSTANDNEMHDIIDNIVSLESSYGDESHLHQYSKSTNIRAISPSPLGAGAFSLQNKLPPGVAEKTSTSCPVKREITKEERAIFDKDRQKKDNHNIIERRRRYNINDRIRELGHMVPKSNDPDIRWNKGTILKAAVDYIHNLEGEQKRQKQAEQQARQMAEMNKKLLLRIQQLEMQVAGGSPQGSVGTSSGQTFEDGETKQMVDTLLNYGSYEAKPSFTQQDEMDVARFPDNMVTIPDNGSTRLSSPPRQNFTPVLGVSPHVGSPQIPLIAKVEPSEMDVMPAPVTSHYPTSSPQNTYTSMQLGIQQQQQHISVSPGYHQHQQPSPYSMMQPTSPQQQQMVATSPHNHNQMGGVSPHPHHQQQQFQQTQDNIVLPSIDDFSMGNTEPGRFTALLTDNQYDDTVMDDIIKDDIFLSDATKLG